MTDPQEQIAIEAWRRAGTGLDIIAFRAGYKACLAAREEPQPSEVQRETAVRELIREQTDLRGPCLYQLAAQCFLAAREDTEWPDGEPREWTLICENYVWHAKPHESVHTIKNSAPVHVVEIVRDAEQEPER